MDSITLAIIDDEAPVIEGLSVMIGRRFPGIEIVGTGRSGTEALSLIKEKHPDIILIDIHMPGLDGLQVIEETKADHPDSIFILVTAYERFDIARKAFELGVFSYLLKPVKQDILTRIIDKACHQVRRRERVSASIKSVELDPGIRLELEKRLLDLIVIEGADEKKIDDYCKWLDINSGTGRLVLLKISDPKQEDPYVLGKVKDQLQFRVRLIAGEWRKGKVWFLMTDSGEKAAIKERIRVIAESISEGFSQRLEIIPGDPLPLHRLCESVPALLNEWEDQSEAVLPEAFLYSEKKLEEQLSVKADFESVKGDFLEYISFFPGILSKSENSASLKGRLLFVFSNIIRDINEFARFQDDIPDLEEQSELAGFCLESLRKYLSLEENRYSDLVTHVLDYIDLKFTENIGLDDAADDAGVSSSYLSRLISSETGIGFVDLLTRKRIEVACQKLSSGEGSIKEISFAVGFSDPNYFSRKFRSVCGISPSEYLKNK